MSKLCLAISLVGVSLLLGGCSDSSESEPVLDAGNNIDWEVDAGPGTDAQSADVRQLVLQDLSANVVIPRYAAFAARAQTAADSATEFCLSPSPEGLNATRTGYLEATALWKESEVTRFGPYADQPLRVGPKVDFWPARPENIDELLNGSDPITTELLAGSGTTVRGLPVVEYLLYGPGSDGLLAGDERRCDYVVHALKDVALSGGILANAWSDDGGRYGWELSHGGEEGSRFPDLQRGVTEVVNRMIFAVEDVRVLKLGKPLGDKTGGEPLPASVESPYAQTSIADSVAAIRGVWTMFYGEFAEGSGLGVVALLRGQQPEIATRFDAAYQAGIEALEAIEVSLGEAVLSHPEQVANAQEVLRELQVVLQVELAQALNVTPGFNDNDGD
jgi:predicted lipoprotein